MRIGEAHRRLLALCAIAKINWNLVAREAQRPAGLDRLWRAELSEQTDQARAAVVLIREALRDPAAILERVDNEIEGLGADVRLTTVLDDEYPPNLRVIFNLPPFLFYRGALEPSDARSIAVVGTRRASAEGLRRAQELAGELAGRKVTVLSGLAKGIDTAAHRATLDAGGRTIAVMGTGITRIYPKENEALAEEIIAGHGALVSQFWPSGPPAEYNFLWRNIVTSGMGQGTVVIEASGTSGARNQARRALEHGKRVFLLKGLVTNEGWAQKYLERGAIEVSTVDEVVQLLRSPEQVERLSSQRRQLVLDLA
jgi:DNA processing protein